MACSYNYLSLSVLMLIVIQPSRSIILCDERCANLTVPLGICTKNTSGTPLYLMGLFPCNSNDFRARGLTVAGQMAVRAVNRNSSILQDYRLVLSFSNTMCQRVAGVRAFINQLALGTTRHMIIGPGCSTGAVTIAETAPFYQLTQISYTATSILLSDKKRFPTFLRTISSDNASIEMIGAVIQEFGWEQVAIISVRNELFTELTSVMREDFSARNVKVISENLSFNTPATSDVYEDIIQRVNVSGARIVILNMFEDSGRQLLCYAYKKGMIYPQYLYISYYWWSEGWFLEQTSDCKNGEVMAATNHSIAVDYFPEPLSDEVDTPTDVGPTFNKFWEYFRGNITALDYPENESLRQGGYVYDAVWTAAFALDAVEKRLKAGDLPGRTSLKNFSYTDVEMKNMIFQSAKTRRFRGVTGEVSFNQFGDREPKGEIYSYELSSDTVNYSINIAKFSPFAIVNENNSGLDFINGETRGSVFPYGVPSAAEPLHTSRYLFVVMTILSVLCVFFAIACIIFNLLFRKKRIVKLTSPYLNVVIIIGGIFFYFDVILFGIDEGVASFSTVNGLCQARIWIASIGFSLLFGPMLAKAFRVYYIFRSVKLKKRPLKDWILLIMVAVMVGIDVLFLIIVSTNNWRLHLDAKLLEREDGKIPLIIGTCSSDAAKTWLTVILGYKAIYLIIGLLLAFMTYNVKLKELRDSKLIVASVFVIFIVSVALTVIGFLIKDDPDTFYGLLGTFILIVITGVLGLLFLPRMFELFKNPSGDVQLTTGAGNTRTAGGNSSLSTDDSAKITELKRTISSLQSEIDKIKHQSSQEDISEGVKSLNQTSFDKGSQDVLLDDTKMIKAERKELEMIKNPCPVSPQGNRKETEANNDHSDVPNGIDSGTYTVATEITES